MLETITKEEFKELKSELEGQEYELSQRENRLETLTLQGEINQEKDYIKTLKESVKSLKKTVKKGKKVLDKRKKEEKRLKKTGMKKVICCYKETTYMDGGLGKPFISVKLEYDETNDKKLSEGYSKENYNSNKNNRVEKENIIIEYSKGEFYLINKMYVKEVG